MPAPPKRLGVQGWAERVSYKLQTPFLEGQSLGLNDLPTYHHVCGSYTTLVYVRRDELAHLALADMNVETGQCQLSVCDEQCSGPLVPWKTIKPRLTLLELQS